MEDDLKTTRRTDTDITGEMANQVTLDGKSLAKIALVVGLCLGLMGGWIGHIHYSEATSEPEYENVLVAQ